MSTSNCPICMEPPTDPVNFCAVKNHESMCQLCAKSFLEYSISSAFYGTCPALFCPSCSNQKKRSILGFEEWKTAMPMELVNKYVALANSLLAFLCGGCHALKSLDVGGDPGLSLVFLEEYFKNHLDRSREEFEKDIALFVSGEIPMEKVYELITNVHFPQVMTLPDFEAWDQFIHVLRNVKDPERRANLHLRYLRDHPRIKTPCCNREHCFTCKIKDFHEGKSCLESTSALDHSVVPCPTCGISLAKGDGCNTVTCVCGKQFSWSAEKENYEKMQKFLSLYPTETSSQCALVLFDAAKESSEISLAKAWQNRYRVDVNRSLRSLFKTKYWPCPSQCCVTLAFDKLPEGIREASELWKVDHKEEVDRFKQQNNIAIKSIFISLYPIEGDRPVAAYKLLNSIRKADTFGNITIDPKLVDSARQWVEANREIYQKGLELMEVRSAQQFLYIYGCRSPQSTRPAGSNSACAVEFCRKTSNTDLTFTNEYTTVERVGSVSCYPAAFASLPSDRSMFKINIDAAPKSSNWLTFGLSRRGMANSSSDGVGRTTNTWGISDDRSSSSSSSLFAASGNEVGQVRKLKVGDVLTCIVDTLEGWAEVILNEDEHCHRFDIPPGTADDYCFAMTFANDHRVSIIIDLNSSINKTSAVAIDDQILASGQLNPDHTFMYQSLKKQLKLIMSEGEVEKSDNKSVLLICDERNGDDRKDWAEKWLEFCGDTRTSAEYYELVKPELNSLLNIGRKSFENANTNENKSGIAWLTWQKLLWAVSWYRENRELMKQQETTELAYSFWLTYMEDAPFRAAMNLVEYHTHAVDNDERKASLAFMKVYSTEMQEWYDYDINSSEPFIERVDKNCRCLPRHCKKCPNPVKKG
eukprot:gene11614-15552_t